MGLDFIYKKGYSYNPHFIQKQSCQQGAVGNGVGALTDSDVRFLESLGYTVLSKQSRQYRNHHRNVVIRTKKAKSSKCGK